MAAFDPEAARIQELIEAGATAFERYCQDLGRAWFPHAPSDHQGAAHLLSALRPQVDSFVELGSGTGVVSILADLCGMDSWGIEAEPALVRLAEDLAGSVGSGAQFVEGSFIPQSFQGRFEEVAEDLPTIFDGADAWAEMGMELWDFDLIYAFHWPGLEEVFAELIAEHARPGALLLSYGATETFRLYRDGAELPLPD